MGAFGGECEGLIWQAHPKNASHHQGQSSKQPKFTHSRRHDTGLGFQPPINCHPIKTILLLQPGPDSKRLPHLFPQDQIQKSNQEKCLSS